MRKIESRENIEKKQRRNVQIASLIMLVILVFGTVGYAFSFYTTDTEDNSHSEEQQEFRLSYGVEEVGDVQINTAKSVLDYRGEEIYIQSDNQAILSEVNLALGNYASRIQEGCYGSCDKNLPEKNCSDNLIIWKDSSENKVYEEDNCVFIEGDLRAVDAFLYDVLDIKSI